MRTRTITSLILTAWLLVAWYAGHVVAGDDPGQGKPAPQKKGESDASQARNREAAVKALLARLKIGDGATIADIGAGKGQDTWVFAQVVGPSGTVYAEEITKDLVDGLKKKATEDGVAQVRPVLGKTDDPQLPPDSTDLAFMHHVYHHVTKPRELLRAIWRGLKPGGYLVIVDRNRGVLREWVDREQRGNKHFWIAETTVVREAREEGFAFHGCPDDVWQEKDPFLLIFQRPRDTKEPGSDPDPFQPISSPEDAARSFLPDGARYPRTAFVALGEARQLIAPILKSVSGEGVDVVLEEWATQKDERPPLPEGLSLPAFLTQKGDPQLGPEPIDAVFFLDSYHLLFNGDN
ncbi:MAG: methyltransferase domain-containing protein, partial [Planctomycetes bacterium]|nr:methyltransferase domain-containing protein [Planctomycetota bacterium]